MQNVTSSRTASNERTTGGGTPNDAQQSETTGWCQKLKKAFVFHYQYLEDVLEAS